MLRLKQHKLFDGQRMEKQARFLKVGLMVEGAYALVFWEKVGFLLQLGVTSFSPFCVW